MLDILSKRKQKHPASAYNPNTNNQFKNFNFVSSNEDSSLSIHNDFENYNQNINNAYNSNSIYGYNNIGGRFFPSLMNFNQKNNFNFLRKSNFSIPLPQRNPKTPNLQPIINKTLSGRQKAIGLSNENLNNNYFEINNYRSQISPYPNSNSTYNNNKPSSYAEMDNYEYNPQINYTTSTYKPITISSPKRNQITISNKYPGLGLQQNINNLNFTGSNLDTSQLFATNSPPSSLDNTINFPMSVLPKYPSLNRNTTSFQIPQSVNKNRIIPNPNELINQKRRRDLSPFGIGGGQSYFYNLSSKNQSINPQINNWNQYVNGLASPQSNQMSPSGQYEGLNFDDFEEFNMLTENENFKQEKEEPFQNDKKYSSKIIICEKEGKTSIKAVEAEEIDNNNNIQNTQSISKPQADNPLLNTSNNNIPNQEDYTNPIKSSKTNNNMTNNNEDVHIYIDHHSSHSNSSGFDIDNTKKHENKKSPLSKKPQNDNPKNKKKVQKQSLKRKEKKNNNNNN